MSVFLFLIEVFTKAFSSPKGFEGVSDFQVTGFFSDIQK